MKKLFIAVLVTLIGLAFTAPSFAVEHDFGGYWRVRMYTQKNFDGTSDESGGVQDDVAKADTRTRLFYTATINDNLKFVNAFEMDADWGSSTSYGDIGADAVAIEVKNTYADFNLGALNAKVGTQQTVIHRGFVFDDAASGVILASNGVTAKYLKFEENGDNAGDDITAYSLSYTADLDTVKLTPVFTYIDADNDDSIWFAGLDVDANLAGTSLWGTFVYNGGDNGDNDIKAWLAAAGAKINITDMLNIHGQAFYLTGDDNTADDDDEAFTVIGIPSKTGATYYWSEIMGKGLFDMGACASNNSPGTSPTNITAANIGVTVVPMEKLSLSADLWYAMVNEELAPGLDEDLGFEIDLKATYELVDGLNLDVVGAYLFAGDSTTENDVHDEDPWEVGTRLSLKF
ncbi:alginate export family protein [Desulfobacula toluolica]|uniref:Conserved uncharacterized protein n=1 Tax=Desulfobacula toluolica (strain DSM 7467 / Tol2) TaxID=651182 RepID=K0NLD9_DESTT|nr:hypothetical protein [Desulfobacula toluolica]CCK81545.1 conserved uncharacterized protein [Desulfobacula toluolica Tol2]